MIFNKMNKTKSTLLTACLALGSVGLQAQLPEIKGAEALISPSTRRLSWSSKKY